MRPCDPRLCPVPAASGPALQIKSFWLTVAAPAGSRRFYTFGELAAVLLDHYRAVHSQSAAARTWVPASFGAEDGGEDGFGGGDGGGGGGGDGDGAGAGADLAELDADNALPGDYSSLDCPASLGRVQHSAPEQSAPEQSASVQSASVQFVVDSEHDALSTAITRAHAAQHTAVPYPYGVGDWVRQLQQPQLQVGTISYLSLCDTSLLGTSRHGSSHACMLCPRFLCCSCTAGLGSALCLVL